MSSTLVDYLITGVEAEMIDNLGWTPTAGDDTAERYCSLQVALTIIGKDPTARTADAYRVQKDPRSTKQLQELASQAYYALVKSHGSQPNPGFWLGNIPEA